MDELTAREIDAPLLDDRIRGIPPGTSAFPASEIGARRWCPADGTMSLPVLTLDEAAFLHNRDLMLAFVSAAGVEIAPHAKTPMAPDLALSLIERGAWGATVADIRQATVMLRSGISRLLIANEVGGLGGARRLAALASHWPQAELYVFVDSTSAVDALHAAWRETATAPALRVLVEVGAGRAGARSRDEALAVASAVAATEGRLRLAGVATYEGSATKETPEATDAAIEALLRLVAELIADVRALVGAGVPLVVTAGGSSFFDRVISTLRLPIAADGHTKLVIRSGRHLFPRSRRLRPRACRTRRAAGIPHRRRPRGGAPRLRSGVARMGGGPLPPRARSCDLRHGDAGRLFRRGIPDPTAHSPRRPGAACHPSVARVETQRPARLPIDIRKRRPPRRRCRRIRDLTPLHLSRSIPIHLRPRRARLCAARVPNLFRLKARVQEHKSSLIRLGAVCRARSPSAPWPGRRPGPEKAAPLPRQTSAAAHDFSALQCAFQKTFEEQSLGQCERNDARGHDDHVDRGEIRPSPLTLASLRGGEDDGHGALGFVVHEGQAQQIFAPGGDEIDNEDDDQAVAHHRQTHFPQRPPMAGSVDSRHSNIS